MKKLIASLFIISVVFASCDKDNSTSAPITGKTVIINATSKTNWIYFSFEKDTTVAITDSSTSLNWDIAFRRSWIITNGGLTGSGQVGVFNTKLVGQSGFNALAAVPDSAVFTADDSTSVAANGQYVKAVVNPILKDCFTLVQTDLTTLLVSENYIYIVKTAKGKYAKIWISSYYNASGTSAYITMTYKYQSDGSKALE